jgi:tRNA(Ile)-lysidine synthase
MGGRFQKLQDYFTDKKISRSDKERIRILENGDGAIIWILGYRMDERFRVTGEEAIKISWINT